MQFVYGKYNYEDEVMLVEIFIILILVAIVRPQSKRVEAVIAIYMVLIYGFNTYSGDYLSYQYSYNNISVIGLTHYELLFSLIMWIFAKLGFPFLFFRLILGLIYVTLCHDITIRYTKYPALAMALSAIFPFLYYVSVLRAGIAAMLMLYSVRFLASDTKKDTFMFILFIVLGTLFHYSTIVFLLIFIARKETNSKYLLGLFLGVCVMAYAFYDLNKLIVFIGHFTNREKTLKWFTPSAINQLNWKGITAQIVIVFLNIILNFTGKKCISKIYSLNKETVVACRNKDAIDLVWLSNLSYNVSLFLILFIPFMFVTDITMRFVWATIHLTICSNLNVAYVIKSNSKNGCIKRRGYVPIIQLALVAMILMIAFYTYRTYFGTENSAIMLFFNNLLNILQ